jgi:Putative DNA-binding domain
METIFGGARWESLTLDHVEAFLADAGDEGLTWEAKGTERPPPGSVRKQVCAFANAEGGYLVIGVRREGDTWVADGVDFRGEEPTTWLGQIIRSGLRPVPRYDVTSWKLDDGRHVAVVQIEPVSEPPCMTTSGEVFERVSGESIKVDDPAGLARLYERGQGAQVRAEQNALAGAERVGLHDPGEPPFLIFTITLAPTGTADDISGRLFVESFANSLADKVETLQFYRSAGRLQNVFAETSVRQDSVFAWRRSPDKIERWVAATFWDGSAALLFEVMRPPQESFTRIPVDVLFALVSRAAKVAAELVETAGGYGRARVEFRLAARGFALVDPTGERQPMHHTTIQEWTPGDGRVTDEMIENMKRELLRAVGVEAWEPESPEPGDQEVPSAPS